MKDIPRHPYTVLMQDGYFRLVRIGEHLIIQHEHTTVPREEEVYGCFTWDKWVYCWGVDSKCKMCETKVPKAMQGMLKMMHWER